MTSHVTIVTGAAGALGSAVLRYLRARGHRVAAVDVPAASARLDALVGETGERSLALPLDVGSADAWQAAVVRIEADLGAPTGAVLIAGGWRGGAPHHESPPDALAAMVAVNLETASASLRAVLPGLVARKHGSVVVIGSRAAVRPDTSKGSAAYAASKAAVVALAQAEAAEVLESGVRINAVLPSTIDTPANRAAMPDADPSRWVAADSLASVIAFLLSDDARDVSGAAIPVYGRS